MGRPAKFSEEQLLDAALAVVARKGQAVTVATVAAEAKARVGSVYYRFPNREVLLLTLWVRSIKRFHCELLQAARSTKDSDRAMVAAAVTTVRYCRLHPEEARGLTLYRHTQVLAQLEAGVPEFMECSEELVNDLHTLNDEVAKVFAELTVQRFGTVEHLELVRMAVQQGPYGLVRPFLALDAPPIPVWLEDMVAAMVPAALTVGDGLK